MKKIFSKHKEYWQNRKYRRSVLAGVFFLAAALMIQHAAVIYADKMAGNYVHDIILDNIPVFDVDGILNYGAELFGSFVICCIIMEPKRTSFVLKSMTLFFLIRAGFITLTHLGPSPFVTPINPSNLLSSFITGNDFFFSGHTGMPLLIALIFWNQKIVRYISLFVSVLFGSCVLLGHLHYSIDVFAAFFITYAIYHISIKIFPHEYALFNDSHGEELAEK